jgi:hypothetical protein
MCVDCVLPYAPASVDRQTDRAFLFCSRARVPPLPCSGSSSSSVTNRSVPVGWSRPSIEHPTPDTPGRRAQMNVVVGRGHGTGARKPAHEAPVNAGMGQVRRGPGTVPLLLAGLPRGVPVPVSPLQRSG